MEFKAYFLCALASLVMLFAVNLELFTAPAAEAHFALFALAGCFAVSSVFLIGYSLKDEIDKTASRF